MTAFSMCLIHCIHRYTINAGVQKQERTCYYMYKIIRINEEYCTNPDASKTTKIYSGKYWQSSKGNRRTNVYSSKYKSCKSNRRHRNRHFIRCKWTIPQMISLDMYEYKTNVHQNFSLNVGIIQKGNCPILFIWNIYKQFSKVPTNTSRNTLNENHPRNGAGYEIFHSTLYNRPSDWKRKQQYIWNHFV